MQTIISPTSYIRKWKHDFFHILAPSCHLKSVVSQCVDIRPDGTFFPVLQEKENVAGKAIAKLQGT
jgi:hypothetical protein